MRKLDDHKESLPYTSEWISQSLSISDYISQEYPEMKEEDRIILLEKLNAIQQLDNLMTYDFVKERVEAGEVKLQTFYYDIGSGDITAYDYENKFSGIIKEIAEARSKE